MLSTLIIYLTQKFETFSYLQKVYGLGVAREINESKLIAVYEGNTEWHLNLDTHESCCVFLTNGNKTIEQIESEVVANEYHVKHTYPFKCLVYAKSTENINCSSQSRLIADSIEKSITGRQKAFLASTQLVNAYIEVKNTTLEKHTLYSNYFTGGGLGDNDILIEIEFDFIVEGNQNCFVDSPCAEDDFVFDFEPPQTFCEKVDECLGITPEGSASLFLNQLGNWANPSTATDTNIYNSNGSISGDRTVNVGSALLEFTTAYGHNLIFTDDFLGQGWDFAGIYHNDAGVVYLNGIAERSTLIFSGIGVIDNVNLTNSYAQADTQLAAIGYIPNMADINRNNSFISKADKNEITSSDSDSTKANVEFSHSNGDGTSTPVASVYRDGAIASNQGFYIGDKTTDGSWRFVTSGADLVIQKRESGNWVTKQTLV